MQPPGSVSYTHLDVYKRQDVVDPEDVEMLQDMVCAAVNEALRGVDQMGSARMSSVTGGLNIPGMR